MGDCHNVGLIQYSFGESQPSEILWLYAHNGFWTEVVEGYSASLAHALDEARPRWGDDTYFNRIVTYTLGDSVRGIGTGIATMDDHRRWVIDPRNEEVHLMENWPWNGKYNKMPKPIVSFSFEDFIARYRKHEKTVRNEY